MKTSEQDLALDKALLDYLEPKERARLINLIGSRRRGVWQALPGPQTDAFVSPADVVGYGGAAGGGKTDLIIGLALQHRRVLIARREKAQTEGIVQRMRELLPTDRGYSSQHSRWQVSAGNRPLVEFAGLDNPGDEGRWQGRPHDLIELDEATEMREAQARFLLGWNRTDDKTQRCRAILTFNPPMSTAARWVIKYFGPWLDDKHPNPASPGELRWFTTIGDNQDHEVSDARPFVLVRGELVYEFDAAAFTPEEIITPKSRTFIPARVTDNPHYMATGYVATLQAMPEPMRSRLLYGDFAAGIEDDPYQVIPTAWVERAMARWKKPDVLAPMDSMGVDVALGGTDRTVIARRHGLWFDEPVVYPGRDCRDGSTVAGYVVAAQRDQAVVHIDLFGVGAQPYGHLMAAGTQVIGVNVGDPSGATTKNGGVRFKNLRTQLWWKMREALDPEANTGIALPPDRRLQADLCAPKWELRTGVIQVQSREEIVKAIGRSPDYGSAYCLALMDTMKTRAAVDLLRGPRQEYDPFRDI